MGDGTVVDQGVTNIGFLKKVPFSVVNTKATRPINSMAINSETSTVRFMNINFIHVRFMTGYRVTPNEFSRHLKHTLGWEKDQDSCTFPRSAAQFYTDLPADF